MEIQEIKIWPVLAGLGLFLFGMFMLEESLKALAGRSFKKFLSKQTGHAVKAIIAGATVTAILQSSSMVSLLVMSFAGAGIIGLKNGIGMILGANLGTTATGWVISLLGFKLNIGTIILPFLAIGGLGIIFLKSEKLSNFSKMLMGFSIMFLGLNYMKEGVENFALHFDFSFLADKNRYLFLLAGTLLAATIQSSSASMMIFLASLSAGVINIDKAIYLAIGADLGTTLTAILGTINANSIKRKIGWSQFFFNLFTAILAVVLAPVYLWIIKEAFEIKDPLIMLVSFHSLLNFAGILTIFPFLKLFTGFIDKFISKKEVSLAKNIMLVNPSESHAAIEALHKESIDFLRKSLHVHHKFFNIPHHNGPEDDIKSYTELKLYENEVVEFYLKLLQTKLSEEEAGKVNTILTSIRNTTLSAKDLKDIKHNLDEISNSSNNDIYEMYQSIREHQKTYYNDITEVLNNLQAHSTDDLFRLKDLLISNYQHESDAIYRLYSSRKQKEIVIPSLLNMIRDINNSNEALIRTVSNIINYKSA